MEFEPAPAAERLEIIRKISESNSLTEALEYLFSAARKWIGIERMIILTRQAWDSDNLEVLFQRGVSESEIYGNGSMGKKGPWSELIRTRGNAKVDINHEEWAPLTECFPVIQEFEGGNVLAQSWRLDSDMQGLVLAGRSPGKPRFNDNDARILNDFINEMSGALRNLVDAQRYKKVVVQFRQIHSISSATLSHVDLEEITRLAINSMVQDLKCKRAIIFLLDKEEIKLIASGEGGPAAASDEYQTISLRGRKGFLFNILWNVQTQVKNGGFEDVILDREPDGGDQCHEPMIIGIPISPTIGINRCWEIVECNETDCPVYCRETGKCWTENANFCRRRKVKSDEERLVECLKCPAFQVQGILVVQWGRENPASASLEDISVLELLASNMAIAIQNARQYKQLKHLSITDSLTGLYNHRYFQEMLKSEIQRSGRYGGSISLIMMDLDNFKDYNDTYGHPMGDEILKQIAEILKISVRKVDIVARYGGEEFVAVLPETELKGAQTLADRILALIRERRFPAVDKPEGVTITASLGIASYPSQAGSAAELISRADEALYAAKEQGKNRVNVFSMEAD